MSEVTGGIVLTSNVDGYPNYHVTTEGVVWSIPKSRPIFQENRDGYRKVQLYRDNKQKNMAVHRLVALAYIPNGTGKPQVNHIDGNPSNNHVSNLEWVTAQENVLHAIRTGLHDPTLPRVSRKRKRCQTVDMFRKHRAA